MFDIDTTLIKKPVQTANKKAASDLVNKKDSRAALVLNNKKVSRFFILCITQVLLYFIDFIS